MGWGYGEVNGRAIGYLVPDVCNEGGCTAEIDRGISYVCGGMHEGGDHGCGDYFCAAHLFIDVDSDRPQLCRRCSQC